MTLRTWRGSCRSKGLTLVEVVVGLALLAALLVSTMAAYGRHTGQIRRAQRRLDAIRATDRTLCQWFAQKGEPLPGRTGTLLGESTLTWRITPLVNSGLDSWDMRVVRLEVFDVRSTEPVQEPLCTVDLVVQEDESSSSAETNHRDE